MGFFRNIKRSTKSKRKLLLKKDEGLLRDLLLLAGWSQADLARRFKISESLVSYWMGSNSAVSQYLGAIKKVTNIPDDKFVELIVKYLR